jgi:flagellar biosynthesis component FlhA
MTTIQKVLQLLLTERVSIRDLGAILEGIAEAGAIRNPRDIAEVVRQRLARQFRRCTSPRQLPIVAIDASVRETAFADRHSRTRRRTPSRGCNPPGSANSCCCCATASRRRRAKARCRC